MISLNISHLIFLTKEQREELSKGGPIKCNGVSIPVWFKGGDTSEPAREVFCNYSLFFTREYRPISSNEKGYFIDIPEHFPGIDTKLPDLLKDDEAHIRFKQFGYYKNKGNPIDAMHTIEIKDVAIFEKTKELARTHIFE